MEGGQGQGFEEPGGAIEEAAVPMSGAPQSPRSPVTGVVERNRERLLAIEGVIGVAEGRTAIGDDAVRIDVLDASVGERTPREVEGYQVEVVVVTGGYDILPAGSPLTG